VRKNDDEKKLVKEIKCNWRGYDFIPVNRFLEVIERQPKIGKWKRSERATAD